MAVQGDPSVLLGSELAGYRIEALVGRGGMGAVYRAQDLRLGRKVALKLLDPELARSERFRERFLRESRLAASLDHPHIAPIYEAGEADGVLFIAMRYVEERDLGRLVAEEGPLDALRALELTGQVASALDAAHGRGLLHRDVKPSNILVARPGGEEHCYLADFGIAGEASAESGVLDGGEILGTLDYLAPEKIEGGEPADGRADVYSLSCVLYECLTGAPPFEKESNYALLWAHLSEQPAPVSAVRPELPAELDAVLARGLAKEPDERYPTCGALAADARAVLAPAARPAVRRRLLAALAALGLAAALAVALAPQLRSGPSGLSAVSPNAVGVIDPGSNKLTAEVPVGLAPEAIAVGSGSVWVANVEDETVSRIDAANTADRARTVPVGDYPSDIAVSAGTVWVALGALAELARINPEQNVAASPIPALGVGAQCGAPRASVAVGGGALWFTCQAADLGRIDPRTGESARVGLEAGLLTSSIAALPEFSDIAFGLGSLWIVNRVAGSVVEVDPAKVRKLREIEVGSAPAAIAVGQGSLWVANFEDDTVMRIAIPGRGQTPERTTIPVGDGPVDVAFGEGGVWVVSRLDRTLRRIDPTTNDVVATIEIGNEPQRVAAGGDAVWVSVRAPEQTGG